MKILKILMLIGLFLGSMPELVWDVLDKKTQDNLLQGYGLYYLYEERYCSEVLVEAIPNDKNIEFHANCNKVKI